MDDLDRFDLSERTAWEAEDIGKRVLITLPEDCDYQSCLWVPTARAYDGRYGRHERLTGVVQKVFKSGKAAVAIDQVRNRSEDGRRTCHLPIEWLTIIEES